jgi:GntP family gluconate:H+ symporter
VIALSLLPDHPANAAGDAQLMAAALLGIVTVVLLIARLRVHPFLALILGSATLGVTAGMPTSKIVEAFTAGVGSTLGGVGLLIALGAMIGALLADSGSADRLVDTVASRVSIKRLPWAIAGIAALVGIPLFFEVGLVLLVPILLLVSRRIEVPLMKIGIPALAGLSVLHGLVPPHPGPLVAVSALKADLGLTLAFGLIISIPTVVIAGPIFGSLVARLIPGDARTSPSEGKRQPTPRQAPGVSTIVLTMLLPIVLMLLRAFGEIFLPVESDVRGALDVAGTPIVALLAGLVVAMFTLGLASGFDRRTLSDSLAGALPPIATILLVVGAGGGFKQTLIDAGVGTMISRAAETVAVSPLILGWLVAVAIRLATGSATVATITAAGIVAPLAATMDHSGPALLALAIGSGSLFFSHVNDAGFWMVKEYFGLSVGETLKTWSVMETIISVVGLTGVMVLRVFV